MKRAAVLLAVPLLAAAPERPPVVGISHVAVQVSDLAKARAFYGEVLGYAERQPAAQHTAIFIVNERQRVIVRDGLPASQDERFIEQLMNEYEVARKVNHPFLRKMVDLKTARNLLLKITEAALVMELFDGAPLEHSLPRSLGIRRSSWATR